MQEHFMDDLGKGEVREKETSCSYSYGVCAGTTMA